MMPARVMEAKCMNDKVGSCLDEEEHRHDEDEASLGYDWLHDDKGH